MQTNKLNKMQKFWNQYGKISRLAVSSVLLGLLVAFSCIYPYNPTIDEFQNLLVIDGHIVKGEEIQEIKISRSSPFSDPERLPVNGCQVNVVDDKGTNFRFTETTAGTYTASIPDNQLKYNSTYQLFVITPDNKNYESTPEVLLPGIPVDSLYFIEEGSQSAAGGRLEGIQFYVDLKAPETDTRYFRWVMEETWEYHRKYPIEVLWDGRRKVNLPPNSDTLVVCYITMPVEGFYSTTTNNLTVNEKKRIPLNFVSRLSNRLEFKYTLLAKQYSLSESAFKYFNTKKIETQESGGFYQSQPGQSFSNIVNPDDSEEKVLGYFWASTVSEKRIFANPPFQFTVAAYCFPELLDWSNSIVYRGLRFYVATIGGYEYTAPDMCFDCTRGGGTLKKPDFWK